MSLQGYRVRKAAHVVAFFAKRQGGSINVLKLAKLVYLADREYLRRYDCPILYDRLVSMDHGPVNSVTLNYINGFEEDADWSGVVAARADYEVALSNADIEEDDLDELSEAELDVLNDVWRLFGHMDRYQIRDYTHDNCPEWENPHGSSTLIRYKRVLEFLGKRRAEDLEQAIESDRALLSAAE